MNARAKGRAPIVAVVGVVLAIGLWNAHVFPPGAGYDAAGHVAYADGLVPGLDLPAGTGEFHNPPLFYLLAGSVDWLAGKAGAGQPHRATQLLNLVFFLVTVLLVWRTALLLWPEREWLAVLAAGFTAFLPVAVRASVMFHPEALDMLLSTAAVFTGVRLSRSPRSRWLAASVGGLLGAGLLVRTFSLWVAAAVLFALLLSRRWRALLVVGAVALVVAGPWYVRQWIVYGTPVPFNRVAPTTALYARRPLSFYFDPGLPAVFTHPYRPNFLNLAIPTTYAELWGDYFGIWNWRAARLVPSPRARRALRIQSLVGVLPTLLAFVGCGLLIRASRRDPSLTVVALLPVFGLLGYLFFTVAYPSADGDVLKATYLLSTTVGWALGFAYALTKLPARARTVVGLALVVGLLAELPYLVYG